MSAKLRSPSTTNYDFASGAVFPTEQIKEIIAAAHRQDVPVLVVTGEASYHAAYDHCTVAYLKQAGVRVEHLRLEELQVRGNGHMMMLELNNLEIASMLDAWVSQALAAPKGEGSLGSTPV